MRRLVFVLLAACHTPKAEPVAVPATFAVTDPADATPTRDPMGPRSISEQSARVAAPSENVLRAGLEPCPPPVAPPPPVPSSRFEPETRFVSDEEIMGPLNREREAMAAPPSVHCHFYLGETQLHLGVRGGEVTRAQLAGFELGLSFRMDPYEGSSFLLEVSHQRAPLLRSGHHISLASPPIAPTCGGPGFTGWLRVTPELSAFCEVIAD